mmetsp:Transcript_18826/g.43790  ORF Transcript_18826/g.43790 Transcript_18826/m.43790 type:complete len:126 (-) Transcript_18826:33-410(-)
MIYSVTKSSGVYMYSRGFGYNKIDTVFGERRDTDDLDSYIVEMGTKNLPLGVEQGMMGMKKGEHRRIQVPANVGFETSNWKPEPTTRGGKMKVASYQNVLRGRGDTQPGFPASTVWDVKLIRVLR